MVDRRGLLTWILGAGASLVGVVIGKREGVPGAEVQVGTAYWYKDEDGVGRWHEQPKAVVVERRTFVAGHGKAFWDRVERWNSEGVSMVFGAPRGSESWGMVELQTESRVFSMDGKRVLYAATVEDPAKFCPLGTLEDLTADGFTYLSSGGLAIDLT